MRQTAVDAAKRRQYVWMFCAYFRTLKMSAIFGLKFRCSRETLAALWLAESGKKRKAFSLYASGADRIST
jgi:hypothetical protein